MLSGFLLFTLIGALLTSCEKSDPDTNLPVVIQLNSGEAFVAQASNVTAPKLLDEIMKQEKKDDEFKNVIISPFSLNIALAMTWNGAAGTTKSQMQEFLGFAGSSEDHVNNYFKKMQDALPKSDKKVKLSVANSIWYRNQLQVKEPFKTKNRNFFYASIEGLNFASPASVNTINNWCSTKTNGLIDQIIETIDESAVMYLINALYFKGEWSKPFSTSQTTHNPFYKRDGTTTNVVTMYLSGHMEYYENNGYKYLSLPYGNGSFKMSFILPPQGTHLSDAAEELLKPATWERIFSGLSQVNTDIFIPKFKFAYEIKFNDILDELGIKDAFNPNVADFSGIAEVSPQRLFISNVIQKAVIDVNEKGSEAAAVTAVEVMVTSAPIKKEFRANRPFFFAITETSTSTILFMGKVEDPVY